MKDLRMASEASAMCFCVGTTIIAAYRSFMSRSDALPGSSFDSAFSADLIRSSNNQELSAARILSRVLACRRSGAAGPISRRLDVSRGTRVGA